MLAFAAACAEQAPPQGAADSIGAPDTAASPAAPDTIAPDVLEPGVPESAEQLAELEGAAGEPTVKFTSPATGAAYTKTGTNPVDVTATISVTNFVLGTDGKVRWYLDETVVGTGTGTSYQFLDLPNGVHRLGARLLDNSNNPVGGATGFASVQVSVSNTCNTTADCASNNACWVAQCLSSAGGKVCKYGPVASTGGTCCNSGFDCTYPQTCQLDPAKQNVNLCVACTTNADCDDGSSCTTDTCNGDGTCSNVKSDPTCCETNADCNDGNKCTIDSCNTSTGKCNAPVDTTPPDGNCCNVAEDCKTDNICQTYACIANECRYGTVGGCCTKNSDCDDKNPCTVNTCTLATNKCDFSVKTSDTCCLINADCNDGNDKTIDTCVANQCQHKDDPTKYACAVDSDCAPYVNACTTQTCVNKVCVGTKLPGCCLVNTDCNDGLPCTIDSCNTSTNKCTTAPKAGCCDSSSQCNDNNACTLDACINNECRFGADPSKPGCCTQNADCNDKNACTVDTCVNEKCVFTNDPNKTGCCTLASQCEDNNNCTYNTCVNNQCAYPLKFAGCCTQDSQCNDSKACTVDICNQSTNKCDHPKLQNSCCSDTDCAPIDKCHKGVCNTTTAQCSQVEIPGTECCTTTADCTPSSAACKEAVCDKGVCHDVPVAGCCAADSDCEDLNLCTDNICNTQTNECEFPMKPGVDPETCKECLYHNDCYDDFICTYDYCIANKCVHLDKANCCEISGETNGESCDDGNDCNIDKCIYNRCRHFPPGGLGPTHQPPQVCCEVDSDCPSDGNECTQEKCNGGECISQAISGTCEKPLPYKEPFTVTTGQTYTDLGFKMGEIDGSPASYNHWELAQLPGNEFGTGNTLRFKATALADTTIESCAVTPIVNTGTATKLQVGWKGYYKRASGIAHPTFTVQMAKDGDWANAQTLWTKTTTGSNIAPTPYQYEIASPSPFLGGKKVQMRFCVKVDNAYGDWGWYIDDVFIVKGNPPVFTSTPFTQQVNVGASKLVPLAAKDADGDALTFSIKSGPSFVTLGTPYWYQAAGTWNVSLTAAPANDPTLAGYYPVTVRVEDGVLAAEVTFQVVVKHEGGYLIWEPADVTVDAGQNIKALLGSMGQLAQVQQSIVYYPDLTKFKAVFVTLGAYPKTHTLTTGEANKLKTYLDAGGRLYLEGSDTFYYDAQTSLHPYFKVTATADGAAAEAMKGYTVLDGKAWKYSTSPILNSSVDRLEAQPGGTATFMRNEGALSYATVVAHDATAGYRALASSVLMAGMQNDTATRTDLMAAYLDFFENGLPGCFDDTQCADGNACTDDSCDPVSKECVNAPTTGSCDDGNACTTNDTCASGACQGTPVNASTFCTDNNPCTTDYCDSATGCQHTNNTASCSDGNACTTGDKCTNGSCTPTGATNCNDGNVCTEDTQCNPSSGCVNAPKTGSCDDGNVCTIGDSCSGGTCQPGTGTKVCNDGNDCTVDSCDPNVAGGCKYVNAANGAPCSDNNACTTNSGDKCDGNGTCVGGATVNCDDGKVCTTDTCVPASGCVNQNNTVDCDDGNQCTINDKCLGGTCSGSAKTCPDDGNVCTTESCDPAQGCIKTNNTNNCNDNDSCTSNDKCSAGNCAGTSTTCNDNNPCTTDSCNTTTGACVFTPNPGASCDDGNQCQTGDKCDASGVCKPGSVVVTCNDGNPCTTDSCNASNGQCQYTNVANGTGCSDGDACTVSDKCNGSGQCIGTQMDCNDSNTCTTDSCSGGVCVYTGNAGTSCNDGNKCTLNDKCGGTDGKICGGTTNPCDDSNVCTSDACNPAGAGDGCVHNNNTASCSDGNPCTLNDVCSGGSCQAGTAKDCNDGNVCTLDSCNQSTGNCDYANNDAHSETCYTGSAGTENVGLCHGGLKTCVNKVLTGCTGEVVPITEACDGDDNDCDGQLDEGCLPASMRFIIPSAIIKGSAAGGTIRGGLGQPLGGKAANGTGYKVHYGFYPTTVGN